ncbi:MAG: M15 family metallopeptidase [Chthonomonas sp.]|nr:M15 family metallopeptidase [Chthonomonas sp.]
MNKQQIIELQRRIGTTPDGFWGPQSEKACRRHLLDMMPANSPFPSQARVESYYGKHGVKDGYTPPTKLITLPFTIYYENSAVKVLRPHEKCADSLLAVFQRLAEVFPDEASRRAAGILTYGGLYNPRKMRGANAWSMHSWAIAIDLDAGRNGNQVHWPKSAVMPIEVMECFAKEGWTAAGAFWARDAMHFQATKP